MALQDLRAFIELLEQRGALRRIGQAVDPYLEITEVSRRVLARGGPALLFEQPTGHDMPLLAYLFGTAERVAWGMGRDSTPALREVGELLAVLREPEPPAGLRDAWRQLPVLRRALHMPPKHTQSPLCRQHHHAGSAVDLGMLPVQTCWPGDAAPLITWALVLTRGPGQRRQNVGIYRLQVLDERRVIMRWLAHRGGAADYRDWCDARPGEPFPVAVVLGADPATLLAAVTPVPDSLGELAFAGLLRGSRTEVTPSLVGDLEVPARAEILLEGHIHPGEEADEGPFGDHTGYYNEVERFPVLRVEHLSHRTRPIYHSTYTGRPPDEPAVLGLALTEVFIPLLKRQFPEVQDFHLPAEACSYRLAVVSLRKQYPGHAKRILFGLWSVLRQFMYTKFVIVVDDDIDVRNWADVLWAVSTRVDPLRDCTLVDNTPIDYLDFASPRSGLGSKLGIDATGKWPGETDREWGRPIRSEAAVVQRIDALWDQLGLESG